jgi:antitoxin component YwqK of YwqJK toxin-antitoxin module
MKKGIWVLALLFAACGSRDGEHPPKLVSLQLVDRNGFQETISTTERIDILNKTNFLDAQPYQKVVRLFSRNKEGKKEAIITSYHENGQLCQYLETKNGRACGSYREWHPSGSLKVEAHVVEGMGDVTEECVRSWIFHGESKAYDDDEKLVATIFYNFGELHGEASYYYTNAQVKKTVPYHRGKIEGNIQYYDKKGNLIGKSKHKNGIKHGLTVYLGTKESPRYTENFKDGNLVDATYYDFGGKVLAEVTEGNGEQAIFEKGKLCEIHEYSDGTVAGVVKQYDQMGFLTAIFTIKENQKHGEETLYFDKSQQRKMTIDWYEDEIHGNVKTWYRDGQLESEREMYNNKKHGNALAWYRDGNLMLMEEYEHDNLANGSYYKKGGNDPISYVEEGAGTATLYDPGGHFVRRTPYLKGLPIDE